MVDVRNLPASNRARYAKSDFRRGNEKWRWGGIYIVRNCGAWSCGCALAEALIAFAAFDADLRNVSEGNSANSRLYSFAKRPNSVTPKPAITSVAEDASWAFRARRTRLSCRNFR